jgi:hypothetical protein
VTVPVDDDPPVTLLGLTLTEDSVTTGGVTVRDAVWVTPLYDAEMVTEVDVTTGLVVTVKVAVVAPLATVTLAGTEATAVLLLESETRAPPLGAGPLRVTVPVDDDPPVTLLGLTPTEDSVTAGGVTVSDAVCVAPLYDAEMLTEVEVDTVLVLTVKVAVVAPAETVTLDGTEATAVLLLESWTTAPPLGAGALRVTVPVEELPPATLAGFNVRERLPAWVAVVLINTETVFAVLSATARSSLPSPLKSPTATAAGPSPTPNVSAVWKVPSPLPRSTETMSESKLATARSGLPSPLKSPTVTERGGVSTRVFTGGPKVPSPLPGSTETVLEL